MADALSRLSRGKRMGVFAMQGAQKFAERIQVAAQLRNTAPELVNVFENHRPGMSENFNLEVFRIII